MKKKGFKKTVCVMLAALMTFNAMNLVVPGNPVRAAEITQEKVVQKETEKEEVTAATPVKELEGEVLESEINSYSKDDGEFTVNLKGGGYTVSYTVYIYNVKNLEPAEGATKTITKIGTNDIPSATEPQWKVKRIDSNGSDAKSYFDLSFEELILRRDGASSNSQGWSGAQVKIKFNMDKHVYKISQNTSNVEQGRLCLIASEDPLDLSLESRMEEENNTEAMRAATGIHEMLLAHEGATGITGYIQCNAYNCGLADYNEDGNYSNGNLTINFNKGKETLKINPNNGRYTHKVGDKDVEETSTFTLATRTCSLITSVGTPKRNGYTFVGWSVTHGTGGNGSYDASTKKYTHCTMTGTGETTLKAEWRKNDTTPEPEPTATPIPKYKATVKYYKCPYNDTTTGTIFETTPNMGEYALGKNIPLYINSKCPIGYFYYGSYSVTEKKFIDGPWSTKTADISFSLKKDTEVNVIFMPNKSTLQVDPNGGTWNESTEVQSFTQAYGTALGIPQPAREQYEFNGWDKRITNGKLSDDNATYEFGPMAEMTDCITAQWNAFNFTIKYERNEPSGIGKVAMCSQDNLNIESQDSIYDVGAYENAKFLGWCLAKGNWESVINKDTGEKEVVLTSVRWLTKEGTFDETETLKGEKRFDTTGYAGKVFANLAGVKELVPYIERNGDELTLVGMWTVDVDFDAKDGINTENLAAGQHGIVPDIAVKLIDEAPSLKGNEFVQWINSTQQTINSIGESVVQTGKNISVLAMESALELTSGRNTYKKGQIIDNGFGKNEILYATYQYYIQYQKADGTIIKQGMNIGGEKTYGKATTISDVIYPTTGNREGYHYTSEKLWKVVSDDSERYKYADAANYPKKNYSNTYKQGETALVNRSVILRAAEEANTYIIKYNVNNSTASTKSIQDWSKMKEQKITYGESVKLTDITGSELPGYTFAGWNTKADGSGVSFFNKESSSVKQFLTKAGTDVDQNGAVINLYAQWTANTYTITFDVNRPSTVNNTHASSNAPVLNGTVTVEYVWDSVIADKKIEDLNIPRATLKGWHQRFQDSLWYTRNGYNAAGNAIKNGTRLGYEILGIPGNKTVYAQWEANTYMVYYDGNGENSGGRGIVQGEVKAQTLIYDKESKLRENNYKKQDKNYRYHDDEKLSENTYGTKHNFYASDSFKYYWMGWCKEKVTEENRENTMITQKEASAKKIWNLTDVNQGEVVLYAVWDGIPNITTKEETTHFDRYQGARLTASDMKKLVKAYDLEQGEDLEVTIKNISYYEGEKKEVIDNPEDSYVLDTTLPEYLWEDGKYKTYTITFETMDRQGIEVYAEEYPVKEVVYQGKIYYNNEPLIETYNGADSLYDRYFYLGETEDMGEEKLEEALIRQVKIRDKEDEAYAKDKENDLYLGRLSEKPILEVLKIKNLYKNAVEQELYWNLQEKEQGKKLQYTIQYTDIFGKTVNKTGNMYLIDVIYIENIRKENEKQHIRFISKEYFDTLEKESQWYSEEENKKKLEGILNETEKTGEVYQLQ